MVELQLPKLLTWVRFPSPAPSPWQRQASCGNSSSGKFLIAWEIPWPEPVPAGTCRCRGLPGIAPAFAPIVALDSDRILQVRIGGCERPLNSSQSNALQSATGLNFRCRPEAVKAGQSAISAALSEADIGVARFGSIRDTVGLSPDRSGGVARGSLRADRNALALFEFEAEIAAIASMRVAGSVGVG